ncbi:MAG: Hsp20/alpha crystallin family protein, partial [Verrucomicrobiota bacterium]
MPWVKREDLQIDAEDGLVRFAYEHRDPAVADGEKATGSERFEQVLRSPDGVDVTGIEARLEEGILTLTLPKAAERKPVSVKIQ